MDVFTYSLFEELFCDKVINKMIEIRENSEVIHSLNNHLKDFSDVQILFILRLFSEHDKYKNIFIKTNYPEEYFSFFSKKIMNVNREQRIFIFNKISILNKYFYLIIDKKEMYKLIIEDLNSVTNS